MLCYDEYVSVPSKEKTILEQFREGAVAKAMETLDRHIVAATDLQIQIMNADGLDKDEVPGLKLKFEISKHVQAICGLNAVNKTQLSNDPENPVGVIYLPIEKMPGAV